MLFGKIEEKQKKYLSMVKGIGKILGMTINTDLYQQLKN